VCSSAGKVDTGHHELGLHVRSILDGDEPDDATMQARPAMRHQ
jgi:hypothetical protein